MARMTIIIWHSLLFADSVSLSTSYETIICLDLLLNFLQVIFDNHPDWFKHFFGIHCGTWFTSAVNLPTCQQAFHFGGASHEFEDDDESLHPIEEIKSGKIASVLSSNGDRD